VLMSFSGKAKTPFATLPVLVSTNAMYWSLGRLTQGTRRNARGK
jgi:hypothetical protein